MSALARYFAGGGYDIAGYDRISTSLTDQLAAEGCYLHFDDNVQSIPEIYRNLETKDSTLVIYTPAIPESHSVLSYFRKNSYKILKRSEVLGFITKASKGIAIAGTHGKTTISALIAHILKQSDLDCTAFLGGIAKNYNSNLISGEGEYVVMEADEYDRSFLELFPILAVITSIDPDHLDIYGNYTNLKNAFISFANQTRDGGYILVKNNLGLKEKIKEKIRVYTYSLEPGGDFFAENIRLENDLFLFDVITPGDPINNIHFGLHGLINVENAVAAAAVAWMLEIPTKTIVKALLHFSGVKRRFDIQINKENLVFIDDYAHHPEELKACINSVRKMFPGRRVTGIFQPHLYTRTRDLAEEFAESLNQLDELILLDIYPAREEPIRGISSEMILERTGINMKSLCSSHEIMKMVQERDFEILLTLGAGDIDKLVEPIKQLLLQRLKKEE